MTLIVADPDIEQGWGRDGWVVVLPALLDFLPSVKASFLTQNKGGGARPAGTLPKIRH